MSRHRIPWGSLCKLLGVAGLAGVAATGVVAARAERRRRAYTPDEVRARLQERVAAAQDEGARITPGRLARAMTPGRRPTTRPDDQLVVRNADHPGYRTGRP